jgi:aromatic-L-amino-acid decarboxylase
MRDICLDTAEFEMAIGNVGAESTGSVVGDLGGPAAPPSREARAAGGGINGRVDLPPEDFRAAGYDAIDRLVDYYATLPDRPVFPLKTPIDLAPEFDVPAPEQGEPIEAILRDWTDKIVPNSTLQGHPRFFSWVNGGGTQIGALAEALAAGLNPNPGGWRAAQVAAVIENQTIKWLASLMGLGAETSGVFVSGGTMANTAALRMALAHTATWDLANEGLQSPNRPKQLTVYMADHEAHVSFTKALDLLGLGRNALRKVPSKPDYTIDVAALEQMLDADVAAGMTPFCIVGHAGSINVGAIDPFDQLARVARERKLWLHLDGACGALGAILPELRGAFTGIELADSISFDAHKWMGVPYECGCVMVRDPRALRRTFAVSASYLAEGHDEALERYDYFDRGPQMSRGFRALKVWMSLRYYGAEGYRAFFRRTIDNARYAHELVSNHPEWEVLQPRPDLYIYSFRYIGASLQGGTRASPPASDIELDQVNARIADEMKRRQIALVMTTRMHGRLAQRLACTNHRTTRDDIRATFEAMTAIGREMSPG